MKRAICTVCAGIILAGCSPIIKDIRSFSQQNQYHAGFYLFDPATRKVLVDYQGDKYFTPASNTKILTLYAAKLTLPDPLPLFYALEDSSTTYLWPTGDPTFLNPVLHDSSQYSNLATADSLVLSFANYDEARFGSGWAWDDFNTSYSPEMSAYPIYSNLATFTLDSLSGKLSVVPAFLMDSVTLVAGDKFTVERELNSNRFMVITGPCNDCIRQRPFRLSPQMVAHLYSDTLHIPVSVANLPRPDNAHILTGMVQDSVFKVMMQESDNFLAEQLLLQVAGVITDTLQSSKAIDSLEHYLNEFLPDPLSWVDGSGLSRYNMTTPRNIVMLWDQLIKMFGADKLKQLVAVGGKAGTIESWYGADEPYIFGKTGTLRHNHVLSGMLITESGRMLLFSFMNNHYTTDTSEIKEEMQKVLYHIHEKY